MANDLLRGRQTAAALTNKSGGGVIAGDVVILSSGTADSFTTTSSAAQTADWVGVALETIADNATGRVCLFGKVPLINLASSASLGDYLRTHTVAKQAQRFGTTGAGDFGQVLGTGTTPAAIIWGRPDQGSASISALDDLTDVVITSPSTGEVLTYDGANWINDTGGGGSGDQSFTAAYASRPAASNDGDLFLPSDGYSIERDTGAAWVPWGPLFPLTAPIDANYSWINQGGASVVTTNGGIALLVPANASSNLRIRTKSAPSTPYTITACFIQRVLGANFHTVGLGFRESSSGKVAAIALQFNSAFGVGVHKWTNATTFSASYLANIPVHTGNLIWFQISDNGTNRISRWSMDGQNWLDMHSVGRTDFLTANEVCFFGDSLNATWALAATLISWKES